MTANTIGHVIAADTENSANDPGNQVAALDARVIIPWKLQPLEVYGEWGGEDEAGGFFSRSAFLAGLYLPRLGPWHLAELNLEMADTTVPNNPRNWYFNHNFPDGYTYHGQILGHHAGTDGLDLFAELRLHPLDPLTVFLSYDYEEHFRLDDVVEKLHQFRLGAEAQVWKKLYVSAFFGHDQWNNFGQALGKGESGNVTGLGARWEF